MPESLLTFLSGDVDYLHLIVRVLSIKLMCHMCISHVHIYENEPSHKKANNMHRQKQRRRSAVLLYIRCAETAQLISVLFHK